MSQPTFNEAEVFDAALQIPDPEARREYILQACQGNKSLQARIEALLAVEGQEESALEKAASSLQLSLDPIDPIDDTGNIIDRYRLLERIAAGGMAVVYRARQEQPIRRDVALKIIKLGMDTEQVIARFEAERQALALMDHPHIAKIFDAGATETGRPYFVMELVEGVALTDYCEREDMETAERLELFVQVCRAVTHAHDRGVIHRDIKPSNILVTQQDGQAVPKVIDFGIAKATNLRLTEKTLCTRESQIVGTPEYMSPEQAAFGDSAVDARTDVYSLGVLLYQLLTGLHPYRDTQLRDTSYAEICRIIKEMEPQRPSTRLLEAQSATKAKIDKDLDWITMKALEKESDRRYQTAEELSADIEHYRHDEPTAAGPPTTIYRMRKLFDRKRGPVVTAALVAAALVVGATAARLVVFRSHSMFQQHAAGMVQRHVWTMPEGTSPTGNISWDERMISYVDWNNGYATVYDLNQDTIRPLIVQAEQGELSAWSEETAISRDGRQVVYSWRHDETDFYDLRLTDMFGSQHRVLYSQEDTSWIRPLAFSPDGAHILGFFWSKSETPQTPTSVPERGKGYLRLLKIKDGSLRTLRSWEGRSHTESGYFSPDGLHVVFDFSQPDDRDRHDIFVMDVTQALETPIVQHPADDRLLGWSPDGQWVLFTSDRTGQNSLWAVPMLKGLPSASPVLLKRPFYGKPVGFVADGTYYYAVSTQASNVQIVTLPEDETEDAPDLLTVSAQSLGLTSLADWSADGQYLAYWTRQDDPATAPESESKLTVYSLETNQEQTLSTSIAWEASPVMSAPRWSPDGRSLLVVASSQQHGRGLYTVDVNTSQVTFWEKPNNFGQVLMAVWAPGGQSYYVLTQETDSGNGDQTISHVDPQQQTHDVLLRKAYGPQGLDLSPDGNLLAYWHDALTLAVMPARGGAANDITRFNPGENQGPIRFIRWTPDGQSLLFARADSGLWRVDVTTGSRQHTGPSIRGIQHAAVHPDGDRLALTIGHHGYEVWALEDFLPQ